MNMSRYLSLFMVLFACCLFYLTLYGYVSQCEWISGALSIELDNSDHNWHCPAVWKVQCENVAVLSLAWFLNRSILEACRDEAKFALVIPTEMYNGTIEMISAESVAILLSILIEYDWLRVIAGSAVVLNPDEIPACTLNRRNWTIRMNEAYSEFIYTDLNSVVMPKRNATDCRVKVEEDIKCYPCDLLPDIFLVDISNAPSEFDVVGSDLDFDNLSKMGENGRLPFFLGMKGRSAYCSGVRMLDRDQSRNVSFDLTCNNLRMIWDSNFVEIPRYMPIYRLISPESIVHWLICTWDHRVYRKNLPIHCSNWVRQFSWDAVDILENRMNVHYRALFGTVLGAIRNGDVIPWTVDGDFGVFKLPLKYFRYQQWPQIGRVSHWRYTHSARGGTQYVPPLRMFPNCPVRLDPDSPAVTGSHRSSPGDFDAQIEEALEKSRKRKAYFSYTNWRSTGYVDIYSSVDREQLCFEQDDLSQFVYLSLGGRKIKVIPSYMNGIECTYGKKWNMTPSGVEKGWRWYIDVGE